MVSTKALHEKRALGILPNDARYTAVLTEVEKLAHVGEDVLGVHTDNALGDLLDGEADNLVTTANGEGHALALEAGVGLDVLLLALRLKVGKVPPVCRAPTLSVETLSHRGSEANQSPHHRYNSVPPSRLVLLLVVGLFLDRDLQ